MFRLGFILAACLWASAALAQVKVFSPRADSASITIYRDGIALITETRQVELPAEPVTLVFRGVVDSLFPQSAVMTGAERALAETDFSFDQLTPATLIRRSVGKTVALVRTNRQTGRVTRLEATLVSAGNGVVLQAVDGSEALRCSGLPEHLEFSEVPAELNTTPVLSVQLAGGTPGTRTITLSYLAQGFSWSADYVAHIHHDARRMALMGWVTLENRTSSSFRQAQVQVVAGDLNLVATYDTGDYGSASESTAEREVALLGECFPLGNTTTGLPTGQRADLERNRRNRSTANYDSPLAVSMLENVVVTAARRAERETLGDYQLYRLPWPTDLNARQTKQAVFLTRPDVKIDRFYSVYVPEFEGPATDPEGVPNLVLGWENHKSHGLGEPLPAGLVRVFERYAGGEVFAGEASVQDSPVGVPIEIAIARAMNLTVDYTLESEKKDGRRDITVQASHRFVNNKDAAVSIEVRHAGDEWHSSPVVISSNMRAGKKHGTLAWRFQVPARAERSLRYELRATYLEGRR